MYTHNDEIWALEASPDDPSLIATGGVAKNGDKNVAIWKMPHQSADNIQDSESENALYGGDKYDLELVNQLQMWDPSAFVHNIKWRPAASSSSTPILTADPYNVCVWSIDNSQVCCMYYLLIQCLSLLMYIWQ